MHKMNRYCPDVYKGIFIKKSTPTTFAVGFCCVNQSTTATAETLQQVLAAKRANFESNDSPAQCQNCWKAEKTNDVSRRMQDIKWFDYAGIRQDNQLVLKSFEWNCENICNLSCITCGPIFSSRWSTEIKNYTWSDPHQYSSTVENTAYENLDFSSLQRVYFNGGEPFLSDDHLMILKKMSNSGSLNNSEIAYSTNGTVIPSDECIDLWKQARSVRIFLSIDSINEGFEFIRYPAKWQQIIEFLNFLNRLDINIIIDINCTVGIHNVFSMGKLHNWYQNYCKNNKHDTPVSLNIQSCGEFSHGGKVLKLSNISQRLGARAFEYLTELKIECEYLKQLASIANGNDQNWVNYLDQLATHRKLDWKTSLLDLQVEYANILN